MIERFHLLLSVARSSSDAFGRNRFNLAQLFGVSTISGNIFFQVVPPLRPRNRHNVIALSRSHAKASWVTRFRKRSLSPVRPVADSCRNSRPEIWVNFCDSHLGRNLLGW